ncbi:MAG: hypothetical protein ACT4PT_10825 [Methanobacteriota archaeon]
MDLDAWRMYGLALDAGSGLFFIALAAFVAGIKPRRPLTISFAVFAFSFGLDAVTRNVAVLVDYPTGLAVVSIAARLVAWGALIAVAVAFPRGIPAPRGRLLRLPVAVAILLFLVYVVGRIRGFAEAVASGEGVGTAALGTSFWVSWSLFNATMAFFLLLLAMRFRQAADDREARQLALVAAAMAFGSALGEGIGGYGGLAGGAAIGEYLPPLGYFVLLAGVWLANAARSAPPRSRWARDVALVSVALVAVGAAFARATDPAVAADLGPLGLARVVGVAILAYAILKHQLFDIDVKVKFTIRQSTVAAVFIGLFFVVSESAQAFFSDRTGTYLGIVAAGALVFAIAPLQRMAERVADAAMPGVRPMAELAPTDRMSLYREHLALAYADGTVDANERVLLRHLRDRLGLDADSADRIESELLARRRSEG